MSRNWNSGSRRGGFGRGTDNSRGMVVGRGTDNSRGMFAGRGTDNSRGMVAGRGAGNSRGMVAGRGAPVGRGSGLAIRNNPSPHTRFPLFDPSLPAHKHRRNKGDFHNPYISREQWIEDQKPMNVFHGNRTFRNRSLVSSIVDFYRVTLHRCKEYEKVMLFTYISDHLSGGTFLPFGPKVFNNSWEFYVNDYGIAQQISELSGKITLLDGSKMAITVKPAVPAFEMNELTSQAITLVLTNQYNCITKEANLANFQNDNVFVAREMICSLNLNSVMINVSDILETMASDLVILNMDCNSLVSLEETGSSLGRFPYLKVLRLAGNKIRSMKELSHLSALRLEELDLRGNGLEGSFKFRTDYVREVRSMFPTLKVLDGEILPKPINFDLEESDMGSLPAWHQNFVHESLFPLVCGFISLYFKFYDEPGRLNLLTAYHPSAVMSMVNQGDTNEGFSYSLVSAYQPYNRNFMIAGMRDTSKSGPLLYQGPQEIVSVLKTLPPTHHLLETFTCDLVLFVDDNLLQIVLTGLFKEFGNKPNVSGKPVKSFTRCFVMIRQGNGFLIVNDSLVIRYPTHSQFLSVKNVEAKRNMPLTSQLRHEPVILTTGMDIDEVGYSAQENPDSSRGLQIKHGLIEDHNQNQLHYVSPALSPELNCQIKQEPIADLPVYQLSSVPPALSPELTSLINQESNGTLTEYQPLDNGSPMSLKGTPDSKRRKRSFAECNQAEETPFCDTPISSSETSHEENVRREGTSQREDLIASSPSSSCSSERQNVLVSHLVTVYSSTTEEAKSLLEAYKWDFEAVLIAINNGEISIRKSP